MTKVFKYSIGLTDYQTIMLPMGAKIVDVSFQEGNLRLWAIVDDEQNSDQIVEVWIHGTGHEVTAPEGTYFKSVHHGGFVWHVFVFDPENQEI